jgi:hypothetical protein
MLDIFFQIAFMGSDPKKYSHAVPKTKRDAIMPCVHSGMLKNIYKNKKYSLRTLEDAIDSRTELPLAKQ